MFAIAVDINFNGGKNMWTVIGFALIGLFVAGPVGAIIGAIVGLAILMKK